MLATLITALLAAVLGLLSTVLMTLGSKLVEWSDQSWGGESATEVAVRRLNAKYMRWGFITLGAAFLLTAVSAVLGYFS